MPPIKAARVTEQFEVSHSEFELTKYKILFLSFDISFGTLTFITWSKSKEII